MPRDGSGNFTLPANTQAVSGDPISSTKFNTLVQDLEADANVDRPIAAGGTGASTALAARANLGLEIGVNVQAFDAGLLSIAGLTTAADRGIYTTASDTYAVYTLTAAGRAILDDADASAQRTTLGLGTAAIVNTGTSGATIPLLNAANTWSAAQTFSADITWGSNVVGTSTAFAGTIAANPLASFASGGHLQLYGSTSTNPGRVVLGNASQALVLDGSAGFTYNSGAVWHAGNDGAGTGLDADLLDGVQPSAFGLTIIDDADASAARTTLGLANGATTTISAFALTMLDDVDASAVRTTLGLGTAALKNTGTSGDAVPLLNAANTFSDTVTATRFQVGTFTMDDNIGLGADIPGFNLDSNDWLVYYRASNRLEVGIGAINAFSVTGSGATILGNTAWHAGNDGAGSGLDADTVDGAHVGTSGAAIPLLNGSNSWSSPNDFVLTGTSGMATATASLGRPEILNNSTGAAFITFHRAGAYASYFGLDTDNVWKVGGWSAGAVAYKIWHEGNDGAGSGLDADTLDGVQGSAFALLATDNTFARNLTFSGYRNITLPTGNAAGRMQGRYDTTGGFHDHLITGVNWLRNASGSSGVIDTASNGTVEIEMVATNGGSGVIRLRTGAVNTAPTDRVVIDNSGLQARAAASTETTGTLTVASANTSIQATGDITVPNAVFAAGDIILIYAGASARTITQGASVTMRLGGTATTGSRTLAARGVAMLFFVSSSEVVVSGGAVT